MKNTKSISVLCLLLVATASTLLAEEANEGLAQKVEQLEARLKELETLILPMKDELLAKARRGEHRKYFEERYAKDAQTYSRDELEEIEAVYQVANRQWNSPEAQESLKELISKYDKANRTGCAILYLGKMSKGEDREKYLKMAIADFSDCAYGDGVQVGAYARYCLAYHYRELGRTEDAKKLIDELRMSYPEAIDHKGNLLADAINRF
jgi:hypothetical protein